MRFRPAPLVTVVVFLCVAIQLRLGWWQYGRHLDQLDRKARVADQIEGAPLTNGDLDPGADLAWRTARLQGTFTGPDLFLTGRFEFGEPGLDVLSPLRLNDGRTLLVNRGWLPLTDFDEHYRNTIHDGPATVHGLLLETNSEAVRRGCTTIVPRELPADDELPARWSGPDWKGMADQVRADIPYVLITGPQLQRSADKRRDTLPATGFIARPKHIGHLEYAGQWTLIALVFLGGWGISGVRRAKALSASAH